MKKFKLLQGTHIGPSKEEYSKGDTIETTLDLVAMFPNKFEVINETPTANVDKHKAKAKDNTPESEDVTEKFPLAVENKLQVTKVGKIYEVRDTEDEEAGVLHDQTLKSMDKVNMFIDEYLEDDDDDSSEE